MPVHPLGQVPGLGYAGPVTKRPFIRLSGDQSDDDSAAIAEEVPVAFVYNGESFVVVMASPTDLEDLGVGFSMTEGIIRAPAEVQSIGIVRHSRGIELQITVPDDAAERLKARRRGLDARTGC